MDKLKQTLEIPANLKDAGVPEPDFRKRLDELAEAAFEDQCTGANPRYPLISEIRQWLLAAYDGVKTRRWTAPRLRSPRRPALETRDFVAQSL